MEWAESILRWIFFEIVRGLLSIVDMLWDIIKTIATINPSDATITGDWFLLIITFFAMFLAFKFIKIILRYQVSEEYREKVQIGRVIGNMILAVIITGLLPIVFSFACAVSIDAVENIDAFTPIDGSYNFSTIVLQSGLITTESDTGSIPTSASRDLDINEKESGEYIYYPDMVQIFIVLIVSFATCIIFLLLSVQIGKRFFDICIKYLFAPIAIASIIDPEDTTFTMWMKQLGGDLLMNFICIFGITFVMAVANSGTFNNLTDKAYLNIFIQLLMLIGGLLCILQIPTVIASLTGGFGQGLLQSMQEMQTISNTGRILGSSAKAAGAVALGAGAYVGANALKGAGKVARTGQATVAGYKNNEGGMMSSAMAGFGAGTAYGGASVLNSAKSRASVPLNKASGYFNKSISPRFPKNRKSGSSSSALASASFNAPPTNNQLKAAENAGIKNASSMNRGELSLALEQHGMEPSYWQQNPTADTGGVNAISNLTADTGGSNTMPISQNSSPTNDQLSMAKYYGVENASSMTSGQLQETLDQKSGGTKQPNNPSKRRRSTWSTKQNKVINTKTGGNKK